MENFIFCAAVQSDSKNCISLKITKKKKTFVTQPELYLGSRQNFIIKG